MAAAISRLLRDDRLRREMGEKAHRTMIDKFSWDEVARKTLEVYEETIRLRRANPGVA